MMLSIAMVLFHGNPVNTRPDAERLGDLSGTGQPFDFVFSVAFTH
jgi:hypothetical protein